MSKPAVLFVCVKNSGKSQMAAALMRAVAGDSIDVSSAGTRPGTDLNSLSVQSLREAGVDLTGEQPKPIDAEVLRRVDVVVTLGREAHVDPVPGPRFETWDTDEPSQRGIDGIERMRLIREDIGARVRQLTAELLAAAAPHKSEEIVPMSRVEVFEPALCCATGVCGEDVAQDLVAFSADLDFVRSRGGDVSRYNLASEPLAFAENEAVKAFLHVAGSGGLPLTLVDGVTAMTGRYPDRGQLAAWAGVHVSGAAGPTLLDLTDTSATGGCCGDSGCC